MSPRLYVLGGDLLSYAYDNHLGGKYPSVIAYLHSADPCAEETAGGVGAMSCDVVGKPLTTLFAVSDFRGAETGF